ncbi:SsrA-binding protein SmpB [Candidatus Sumerlaeota bacterium]|nr:SsrA-binding protein SmpB [Candidatus Sumerlaeota bacterium]
MSSKSSGKKKTRFSNNVLIENRRARFEYEVLEKVEAGIELSGCEVKSLREGGGTLMDVYAMTKGTQAFLRGMHIKPYEQGNVQNAEPDRDRRLLLHRKEISRLIGQTAQKGLTLIPLRVYFTERGWAKVELGLCRGKREHDKRDTIRKRDAEREMRRDFKLR